jgi:LysR family transcriptional regulator for metE and metH
MIPRLGIHHLALLVELAETGSVSAAANRLGITQSAASHRLREAERRVGAVLVRRASGGVTLSVEGERLRFFAERALADLSRLEQEIEVAQGGDRVLVRLGQATYSRYHWLPDFLEFLAGNEPGLVVDLSGEATARPLASLREGTVDVSTVYGRPSASKSFNWCRLASDPLVAVMAPDHPLAREAHIDTELLSEHRLYSYPVATEPGFEWESLLGPPSVPFRYLTSMPTPESVIDLVRAGFGVCLFSRWAIEPELADGTLVARPLGEEGTSLDWWTVVRAKDSGDTPAARLAAQLMLWAEHREQALATLAFESRET